MDTEEWLPVVRWEHLYEVSAAGQVRGLDKVDSIGRKVSGRVLKLFLTPGGYLVVNLRRDGTGRTARVHQLVLEAFTGPRPEGCEVLHQDGNRTNNRLDNLRYGTRSENMQDAIRHGTHPTASKTHCPAGHPYEGDNLYITPAGFRECRLCIRARGQRRRNRSRDFVPGNPVNVDAPV